ncbi:hypothetical protein [Bryobacter aggregatus]|uniref:hypothetical protein n=1 Tax=Bryobacter aggregatus TaxID=360054 RepID=UPI0004E0D1D1|nr:hypothetical protein [Bryobacter aggregatus]
MRLFWASCILASLAAAAEPPPWMLWAWEQPMDFSFLAERKDVGVAYLAATAFVDARGVKIRYRSAALTIPKSVYQMPVLRIEGREKPQDSTTLLRACNRLIRDGGGKLQINFDAPPALRPIYGELITALKRIHGAKLFLSMTVLAGWCEQAWFASLPADERVPMLFRMGPAGRSVVRRLEQHRKFSSPACQRSLGYSIDEDLAPRHGPILCSIVTRAQRIDRSL